MVVISSSLLWSSLLCSPSLTHFSSLLFIALPSTARVSGFCLLSFVFSVFRVRFCYVAGSTRTLSTFSLVLCCATFFCCATAAPRGGGAASAIGNWQFAAAFFFFHGQLQFQYCTPNNANVSLVRNVAGQKTEAVASNGYKTNAIGTVKHSTAQQKTQW